MSMVRSPRPVGRPPRESSPSPGSTPLATTYPFARVDNAQTDRSDLELLGRHCCSVAGEDSDGSRLSGSTQAQMDQSGIGWIRSASLPGGENGKTRSRDFQQATPAC